MIFKWLAQRRRRKMHQRPFPDDWLRVIQSNVRYFQRLQRAEQHKVCRDVQVFVGEKNWEGCNGLPMTDEIKVTVSAHIAILCLGFTEEYFDKVLSILVYPDAYVAHGHTITRTGVVLEGDSHREGEAWYRGPVILSWADVLEDGRQDADGNNLILHEFAHQLDMQNGRVVDGVPPMRSQEQYERWQAIISREYQQLVENYERDRPTVLDVYGATDIGEFFAVATESFFEQPQRLSDHHAELFAVMQDYYQQDPRVRFP
jgi:Mlc titration factor MtfA (ptsG expression regulator)